MTIEERLEVVERELAASRRRTKRLWISLGLAGVVCALAWSLTATTSTAKTQGAEKVIRANKFIVEDENGKGRAVLSAYKYGPMLMLIDENGQPRAELSVPTFGSSLSLYEENGKTRAVLGIDKDGSGLWLYDENGKAIWRAP